MHVKTLTTTFGGPERTLALGQFTLVLAPSDADAWHRVLVPLQVAVSGVADHVGRRLYAREPERFAGLFPAGEQALYAHVTLDNGAQGAWGTRRMDDGTYREPLVEPAAGVDAERALPLRGVIDALHGPPAVVSQALTEWIGARASEEDVLAVIPQPFHARYRDIAETKEGSPVEKLLAVVVHARQRLAEVRSEVVPPSDELIEARELRDAWKTALAAAEAWANREDPREAESLAEDARRAVASWIHAPPGPNPAERDNALAGWRAELERQEARLVAIRKLYDPGVSVSDAQASVAAAQAVVDALADSLLNEPEIERCRVFGDACTTAADEILKSESTAFVEGVQTFLPERWRFGIDLAEGAVGFVVDSELRTVLSAVAASALEVAVAMHTASASVAPKRGRPPKVRPTETYSLVTIEALDRDEEILADLMRAWSRFPGQVVLESTRLPKGHKPSGWTILDLSSPTAGEGEVKKTRKKKGPAPEINPGAGGQSATPSGVEINPGVGGQAETPSGVEINPGAGGGTGATAGAPGASSTGTITLGSGPTIVTYGSTSVRVEAGSEVRIDTTSGVATVAPPKKWYYLEDSGAYLRLSEAERAARTDELVEIEGTDDGAPDRHRAQQDDPNTPLPSLDRLGYSEAEMDDMWPSLRARLSTEKIPRMRVLFCAEGANVFDLDGRPGPLIPRE